MQFNSNLNPQVIRKMTIDSDAQHTIIDLTSKGIIIVEKGTLLLETPASAQVLNEGDILYHKQGSYSFQSSDLATDCQLLWVSLDDNFLREFMTVHGSQLSEIARFEDTASDIIKFTSYPLIENIQDSLNAIITHDYPDAIVSLRISELLLLLSYSEQGAILLSNFK